ncbi:hypothetical protein N0B44_20115 [Roseibacterium beibuensis]|uniref:hypothetical protein n=1 Tax=[Roseibacterium] beibuensis TaxID=1193142 RepID=UPI00217E4389|nr:hypothetical protein [Roseibacterium beibuensis]MCS6625220.1 hypothetical protein [Roseibacterium beibuensis]
MVRDRTQEPVEKRRFFSSGLGGTPVIVKEYKGGGRQARPAARKSRGGLVYRLFMKWFGASDIRA